MRPRLHIAEVVGRIWFDTQAVFILTSTALRFVWSVLSREKPTFVAIGLATYSLL